MEKDCCCCGLDIVYFFFEKTRISVDKITLEKKKFPRGRSLRNRDARLK